MPPLKVSLGTLVEDHWLRAKSQCLQHPTGSTITSWWLLVCNYTSKPHLMCIFSCHPNELIKVLWLILKHFLTEVHVNMFIDQTFKLIKKKMISTELYVNQVLPSYASSYSLYYLSLIIAHHISLESWSICPWLQIWLSNVKFNRKIQKLKKIIPAYIYQILPHHRIIGSWALEIKYQGSLQWVLILSSLKWVGFLPLSFKVWCLLQIKSR